MVPIRIPQAGFVMTYNGRNLQTGSDFYAAAMDLMGKGGETNRKVFSGALVLFLEGAEHSDRFCIQRLKEILATPTYLRMVDYEDKKAVEDVLEGQAIVEYLNKKYSEMGSGIFGVMRPTPINHEAGVMFQKKR